MNALLVRPAQPHDADQFSNWAAQTQELTRFDEDILRYPLLRVFTATRGDQPRAYLPVHPVLMLESLVTDPAISNIERVRAMWALLAVALNRAREDSLMEVWVAIHDEKLAQLASSVGFEPVEGRVMRFKLNRIE